ncbi:MAG: hypothetical protein QMC90_02430 [Dehalococcoidales bacterium]|nr:hypothetical protein [Dehalococcoidales bacterium]
MPKLPELVEALLDPKAYPEITEQVEMVQTQMSFVFLTDDYVYKVKKSVNLGYLDYTTLDKRHYYCQREVELNRRLCPNVYLSIVPITRNTRSSKRGSPKGRSPFGINSPPSPFQGEGGEGGEVFRQPHKGNISIDGQGEVIEYAVKMRRLPKEAMMDVLLTNNQVSPEMVTSVAQKLVEFHQKAESNASISAFGDLDTITKNTDENFTQTEKYIGITIPREKYQHIKEYTDSFTNKNASLFHKRIVDGRIRDCHGDLHAAHICFHNGICIYDCIEFNDRFRYCDVASEVAFLAMDLDYYGRADLSHSFITAYVDGSQDKELLELLNFYKCYRAYVRGKVESFKLDDPNISEEEKKRALAIAKSYFELAVSYI